MAAAGRPFWALVPVLAASVVLVPLATLLLSWLGDQGEVWSHLRATQLSRLVWNTLILLVGVGICTAVIGVGLAWLITYCDFPGRGLLDWALMLPLAVPTYVLAFVVLGQWDFMGPIQRGLRAAFGPEIGIDVRGPLTVVLVLSGVLYPYVYLLARGAFRSGGSEVVEAARILGLGPWGAFFRVSLPMARPAIAAGLSLALMETLADFGAVAAFNYETFTTAIYKAWFGFHSLQAAAQLSTVLLALVALALVGERGLRGRRRYDRRGTGGAERRIRLGGWRRWAATGAGFGVLAAGFLLPVAQLAVWALAVLEREVTGRFLELLGNTLVLGISASGLVTLVALMVCLVVHQQPAPLLRGASLVGNLGYALPGSVLAVGVALGFGQLDAVLPRPLLLGSLGGLLLAYLIRFMAVASGPLDSALQAIRPSLPEAARLLGAGQWRVIGRIYVPMLRPGLMTAALLVLVDTMKEMPATLLLRPFGWDTLAVRIYEMTSEGEWQRAALPALCIVLAGLVPVVLLIGQQYRRG